MFCNMGTSCSPFWAILVPLISKIVPDFKMEDSFYNKYSEKLLEKSAPGTNGECRIWTSNPNRRYGEIRVDFSPHPRRGTTMPVHRLAYMLRERKLDLEQGLDVSHLCHNTKCINAEHLSLEPHGFNNTRQSCVSYGTCFWHPAPYPLCRVHLKMQDNNIGKKKFQRKKQGS